MPRDIITLECKECKRRNYTTTKNKRTQRGRLSKMKFCPHDRKHTEHQERR